MHQRPSFRERLRKAEPLHGFFVPIDSAAVLEIIGFCGFDFVIIDMEHGPAGYVELENLLRATGIAGMEAIVRVPNGEASGILRALDAGANGIMVPHVTDGTTAAAIAASCRFPPRGKRGVATLSRAARYGTGDRHEYLRSIGDRTTVIPMIEDVEALPHAAAIAAAPGVDAVFIGPNDLAASMGHPGNPDHPEVAAAMATACAAISPHVTVSTTAGSPAEARQRQKLGYRMLCYHIVPVIVAGLRSLRSGLDEG